MEYNPRKWLSTQVETAIQMSDKPPKIAVWGVVLNLPNDIVQSLLQAGAVYGFAGYHWFDFEQEGKTVCIPIKEI